MFIISKLNPLDFKVRDNKLPNWENTLEHEQYFDGIVKNKYLQKFLTIETITIQFKTDYDSFEIKLWDAQDNSVSLSESLIYSNTDEFTGQLTKFYKFSISAQKEGEYYITIKAIKSGEVNLYYESETFELIKGVTKFRETVDGNVSYIIIPDHYKIEATNNTNKFDLYYEEELPFITSIWIPSRLFNIQSDGDVDVYDNDGNLAKLQEIFQNVFELKTCPIPRYLAQKLQLLSALDFFNINGLDFVNTEKGENEYFDNFSNTVLTMNLTQKFAVGINSDDKGFNIQEVEDMVVINKEQKNTSGSISFDIPQGYSINQIIIALKTGTNGTVKIGTTVGGEEIVRTYTLTDTVPQKLLDREYVKNVDSGFTVYVTFSGIGATFDIYIQTIKFTQ